MAKEKIIIWKQHFACKTAGTLKQRNKFLRSFDDDRLEGSLRLRRCMQSFFTGGGGGVSNKRVSIEFGNVLFSR